MEWARILAYITGTVDQQLLLRNEYLVVLCPWLTTRASARADRRAGGLLIRGNVGRRAKDDFDMVFQAINIR